MGWMRLLLRMNLCDDAGHAAEHEGRPQHSMNCRLTPDLGPQRTRALRRRDLKLYFQDGALVAGEIVLSRSTSVEG